MHDIDSIISAVTARHPNVEVQQLRVSHPADDDGVWFFRHPDSHHEVQLESSTGMFPFLVESEGHQERETVGNVHEAVQILEQWLDLPARDS
jgi:hypothetical protein